MSTTVVRVALLTVAVLALLAAPTAASRPATVAEELEIEGGLPKWVDDYCTPVEISDVDGRYAAVELPGGEGCGVEPGALLMLRGAAGWRYLRAPGGGDCAYQAPRVPERVGVDLGVCRGSAVRRTATPAERRAVVRDLAPGGDCAEVTVSKRDRSWALFLPWVNGRCNRPSIAVVHRIGGRWRWVATGTANGILRCRNAGVSERMVRELWSPCSRRR